MARILIIDTAGEKAGIALSDGGQLTECLHEGGQQDQAAWLQPAIAKLFQDLGIKGRDLDGIAVSAGPGSYTGLRVGMASAKGLCYSWRKPLIAVNTLKAMAWGAKKLVDDSVLLCPMIDARRMEVFTALFDYQLVEQSPAHALILEPDSFDLWLRGNQVCFFGNGAPKYKNLLKSPNALFISVPGAVRDTAEIAAEMYASNDFADLAYAEPFYVKAFYTPIKAK